MIRFLIVAVLIIFVIVIVYVVRRSRSSPTSGGFSFSDFVKTPALRDRLADRFGTEESEVDRLKNEPPDRLVGMLAAPTFNRPVFKAIKALGDSAAPYLVAALHDPEYRTPYRTDRPHAPDPDSPIMAVLNCLLDTVAPEAASSLSSLVSDDNGAVQKEAALVLGTIGTEECLPALAIALADKDKYVRTSAIMGISSSIQSGRASDRFKRHIFDLLEPLAWSDTFNIFDDAALTMLMLDRDRAIKKLATPDELRPSRDGLQYVLRALAEAEVIIDESLLLDLAAQLRRKPLEHPRTSCLAATLSLLALHDSERALKAIRTELDSPDPHVREHAATALGARMELHDPIGFAFDRLNHAGWDALTVPQQHVLAVRSIIDEVNNGGFAQYFVNSSGDHWSHARNGLLAIEAQTDLNLLDQAITLFASSNPSTNSRKRHKQLARIMRRDERAFDDLETIFYEDQDTREALMLTYIMKHPDHFR